MSAETVREWQKMYRVIGRGGLLAMGVNRARYDYETKVAAARAVVDGGMSKPEAMVRFGIASATSLKNARRAQSGARQTSALPYARSAAISKGSEAPSNEERFAPPE